MAFPVYQPVRPAPQPSIQPHTSISPLRCFPIFVFVFALCEGKNEKQKRKHLAAAYREPVPVPELVEGEPIEGVDGQMRSLAANTLFV
jgi:hypothetical protein